MISKELLSEVLGDEYKDRLVDWFQIEDNYLRTYYDCGSYDHKGRPTGLGIEINIYELAHKCKEWAYKRQYYIKSYLNTDMPFGCVILDTIFDDEVLIENNHYSAATEPEAIFKACQWILDNVKTNSIP